MPNMPEAKRAWRRFRGNPSLKRRKMKTSHNRKFRRTTKHAIRSGKELPIYRGLDAWDID